MIFWALIGLGAFLLFRGIARAEYDLVKELVGERQSTICLVSTVLAAIGFLLLIVNVLLFAWRYLP